MRSSLTKTTLREHIGLWWQELSVFPWRQMGAVLTERFRDARLGVSASSLTFTTVLAMVPPVLVVLSRSTLHPVLPLVPMARMG
jgi:membrane protein